MIILFALMGIYLPWEKYSNTLSRIRVFKHSLNIWIMEYSFESFRYGSYWYSYSGISMCVQSFTDPFDTVHMAYITSNAWYTIIMSMLYKDVTEIIYTCSQW